MKKLYLATLISSAMFVSACSGDGGASKNVQKAMDDMRAKIQAQQNAAKSSSAETATTESNDSTGAIPLENGTVIARELSPRELRELSDSLRKNQEAEQAKTEAEKTPESTNSATTDTSKVELPTATIQRENFKRGAFKNVDVGIGKISGFNRNYSFNGAWAEINDPSVLEVAGKKMLLATANKVIPFSSTALNTLWNAFKNPDREVFYGGIETDVSNIPTTGKITYTGYATRYDNIRNSVDNVGKTTLVADFDNKKISGELDMEGLHRNISLKETDIQANGFAGEAVAGENSLLTTRYGDYEGKFYGPNAEEVAGKVMFSKEKNNGDNVRDLNTSFSASQAK